MIPLEAPLAKQIRQKFFRYSTKLASNGMKRPGITLIELLLYMALSGVVVLTMVGFLSHMFEARTVMASQTSAQGQARSILERMTVAIRHGYQVQTTPDSVTVLSHPAAQPMTTNLTTFRHTGHQLLTGSGPQMLSMTEPDTEVIAFSVNHVSSAVVLSITVQTKNRTARLQSTIAYRQTP